MTLEEQQDYNNAKIDIMKAMHSFQKLKPELQEQLMKEMIGAEAYASAWQILQRINSIRR